jgi:alpha-glucosidase
VADQRADSDSVLNFYRALIRLRRQMPVLNEGAYQLLLPTHPQIYAYTRSLNAQQVLVIVNFSAHQQEIDPQQLLLDGWQPLLSNYQEQGKRQSLRAYEAQIYQR